MKNNYIESIIKQCEYYKLLAEKTFEQIPPEKFSGSIMKKVIASLRL